MPKPYQVRHGKKPSEAKALRQSPSEGHSPKGLWVAQAITGGELFYMNKKIYFIRIIALLIIVLYYWFQIRPVIKSDRCINLADYWMIENSDDELNYKEFYKGYVECMKGHPDYMLGTIK